MSAIIYRLTNTVNQKTYIGRTVRTLDLRWREHITGANRGSSCCIHNAIRNYGPNAFIREVLEETTAELVNAREQYWIAQCAPEYNMTAGGDGVVNPTPETRAKMRAAHLGNPVSAEARAKISVANSGRTRSAETRAKISAAKSGVKMKPRSPEHCAKLSESIRGEKNPMHGKLVSPETRAKLSRAGKGRKFTPEHRAKISAAIKAHRASKR